MSTHSKDEESWTVKFLGQVARSLLYKKYQPLDTYHTKVSIKAIENDGRREPTVRKALVAQKLLSPIYSDTPNLETFEAVAPAYGKPMEFLTEVYAMSGDWRNDIKLHKNVLASYVEVHDLQSRELIYMYFHQDEYDFKATTKKTIYTKRHGYGQTEHISHKLLVYPKALIPVVTDKLCRAKMEAFLKDHIKLAAEIIHDIKLATLSSERDEFSGIARIQNDTVITCEEIDARIAKAEEAMSFYGRALEDLRLLRAKHAEMGDNPDIFGQSYDKAIAYLTENAPLYINEEDKDLKDIAELLLKGADQRTIADTWLNGEQKQETL